MAGGLRRARPGGSISCGEAGRWWSGGEREEVIHNAQDFLFTYFVYCSLLVSVSTLFFESRRFVGVTINKIYASTNSTNLILQSLMYS